MITNFKLFEKIDIYNKYWRIETKRPNIEIALRKIGYDKDDEDLKEFIRKLKYYIHVMNYDSKKVYITVSYLKLGAKIWDFRTLRTPEYEYMGEIKITPEEIEEYYIKKRADKYNL